MLFNYSSPNYEFTEHGILQRSVFVPLVISLMICIMKEVEGCKIFRGRVQVM